MAQSRISKYNACINENVARLNHQTTDRIKIDELVHHLKFSAPKEFLSLCKQHLLSLFSVLPKCEKVSTLLAGVDGLENLWREESSLLEDIVNSNANIKGVNDKENGKTSRAKRKSFTGWIGDRFKKGTNTTSTSFHSFQTQFLEKVDTFT